MNRNGLMIWSAAATMAVGVLVFMALRGGTAGVALDEVAWSKPLVERDLSVISGDTLRVLVLADPLSWEERPKAISGLEYDLLRRFAKSVDLPMITLTMDHPDSMLLALQQGKGDIIAAQWTPRKDHRHWVEFTVPYRTVRPVLAVLRSDPVINKAKTAATLDMTLDSAAISAWSPFSDPAYHFDAKASSGLALQRSALGTPEDLLMDVVMGRHRAAVITDARAAHEAGRFPVVEFNGPIGPEQPLCFVVRKNAPELRKRLNAWLHDKEEMAARALYIQGYASTVPKPGPLKVRKGIPVSGDSISPYDAEFQRHARSSGWDWELLAAMAYKESRFDSTAVSSKGAQGIMQIMPRTAERLGLESNDAMGDHINAAARYLNKLDTLWMRAIPDRDQRLRFMLASYNAGPGHIIDAQRLAERLGLDPKRWEHNVERAVLLLAKPRYYMEPGMKNGYCKGSQVFNYVRDVNSMYKQLKARPRSAEVAIAE